jgi:hypothetical protein
MLTEQEKRGWDALDEAAKRADGYLAPPKRPLVVDADYRAMSKYSCERGIKTADLTEEEYAMFLYDEPLIYK